MATVTTAVEEGGRRSRRGYAYQDAVTLLDCLDLHAGRYETVGFEELDDIICTTDGHATYRQVKTTEGATRHSISTVCRPEIESRVETSILGRLFSGKPLTHSTRFCLVLNETPLAGLGAFTIQRGDSRAAVQEEHCRDIAQRLSGLALEDDFEILWFIDRFEVLVEARSIEQVENVALRLLREPVAESLGQEPLLAELEDVLIRLCALIERDARAIKSRKWTLSVFQKALDQAVLAATGRRSDGTTAPLQKLTSKLGIAGLSTDEVTAHGDALFDYRRRYRSAIGSERVLFDSLNDHVFAICSEVSAMRRAGEIAPGPMSYAATIKAVIERPLVPVRTVSQPDRLAALSDVTARCQNRYSDDA